MDGGLRGKIVELLGSIPVRCSDDKELDRLRRVEAAAKILLIPEIKEALAGWGALNPLERAKVIGYPEA